MTVGCLLVITGAWVQPFTPPSLPRTVQTQPLSHYFTLQAEGQVWKRGLHLYGAIVDSYAKIARPVRQKRQTILASIRITQIRTSGSSEM
jgi:hypothetical protein